MRKFFRLIIVVFVVATGLLSGGCDFFESLSGKTTTTTTLPIVSDWWIGDWYDIDLNLVVRISSREVECYTLYKVTADISSVSDNELIFGVGMWSSPIRVVKINDNTIRASNVYNNDLVLAHKSEYYTNPPKISDQYFWGTWVDMNNGDIYTINEIACKKRYIDEIYDRVVQTSYNNTSGTKTTLTVDSIGTFTKQTKNVMIKDNIPYYRQGGTNIPYSVKVVGFNESRSYGTYNQPRVPVTAKSKDNTSYKEETQTNSEGIAVLTAPTTNDTMTVSVETNDGETYSADVEIGITGGNVGTIAIPEDGKYTLKVSGLIDESYLYTSKSYSIFCSIKNNSDVLCDLARCKIEPADNRVSVSCSEYGLSGFLVSNLQGGFHKDFTLTVSCSSLDVPYIDSGLNVTITNADGGEWIDFIPIRFFSRAQKFSVAAKSIENNNSTLNGYVVYPDGNGQLILPKNITLSGYIVYPDGNGQRFTVSSGNSETVSVPYFGDDAEYTFCFCGATIGSTMSSSSEMFYTFRVGSYAKSVVTSGDDIFDIVRYAEPNDTEDTAYQITKPFEGCLRAGDIDFYKVRLSSYTD